MNKFVNIDYYIDDNVLYINLLNVEKKHRRKGLGSKTIEMLQNIALENNCDMIITPSDLSKIALNFWLKNGFSCDDKEDIWKISFVLNSSKSENYIFDIDGNSIIQLSKKM